VRDAAGAVLLEASLRAVLAPHDACVRVATTPRPATVDDGRARAPASTLKLLTAIGALTHLGAEHRFVTRAIATAPLDDGTLRGDLVLVGGGDPVLATPEHEADLRGLARHRTDPVTRLDALAGALAAAGLRRVEGAVVGDDARHDPLQVLPGWRPAYLADGDVGRLSALTVDDAGAGRVPVDDPAIHAADELRRLLALRGVVVTGGATRGSAPEHSVELARVESPPLSEIVAGMLTSSDNQSAELLAREIAIAAGREPTTDAGTQVVRETVAELGIDAGDLLLLDGSGLTPDSRVTCGALVAVVERALDDPSLAPVVAGLPVAGRSGTLATRFSGDPLEGRLRAKTGQLADVVALAGVLDDPEPVPFALLVAGSFSVEGGRDLQASVAALVDAFPAVGGDLVPPP
jgi:D-alanyl-D-alanine carboxypeptidase/D-alanyl-D-alanine-endopeptidase (penicillin-binding protein 4)